MAASMKAIRAHAFGSPGALRLDDIPIPKAGPGEVLIRVKASGVGQWDADVRSGRRIPAPILPFTIGAEISGVIGEVGEGVDQYTVGDEVFGVTNEQFTGANAEYAIARADMIAIKPRRLGHIEASSAPIGATAAWQMLFDHARVAPGQSVLVLGGAGNIGAYAIQFGRMVRAHIIATAFDNDVEFVIGLDADEVVDYRFTRDDGPEPVDAIIDAVGGDVQRRALTVLKPGGVLVSAVAQPDIDDIARRGIRVSRLHVEVKTRGLNRLAEMFDAGEIDTNIGTILPLAEAVKAHEMLEGMRSRPRGKIVLQSG
ncbi:MAG: NADP-dependent oxidoreductase [Proteobacteria bacterium]|nr:NADP-dependent oxidoreductase [Pseudomonadota bacterium]